METPLVSIILPTRNRAALVGKSIQSVLGQTYKNLELLVVDDGSSDGTQAAVGGIRDARIRLLRTDGQHGISKARNYGLSEARGQVIGFQDSDDIWLPEKLRLQMEVLEKAGPDTGVIYSAYLRSEGKHSWRLPAAAPRSQREGLIFSGLLRGNWVTIQTALVRKACLDEIGGFDEELSRLVDWDIFLRLARKWPFAFIDEVLVHYRLQLDSVTRDYSHFVESYERILQKNRSEIQAVPGLMGWHLATLANRLCLSGKIREGRRYYLRALRSTPQRPAYWGGMLLSLAGATVYQTIVRFDRARRGLAP